VLEVEYKSKPHTVKMGQSLDGWQLVGYEFKEVPVPDGRPERRDVTYWSHAKHGDVVVEQTIPKERIFEGAEGKLWKPDFSGAGIKRGEVDRNRIAIKAYQLPNNPQFWRVPQEEQDWWEAWGEEEVFSKLAVRPHVDAKGESHGIKLMTTPGPGTALEGDRGLLKDDIVKSINGVPVHSKEEALGYVRGDGKDAEVYVVVYERAGVERTVTYDVPRRRRRRTRQ
jgi:hypothetical protein